jgi:hypothetical protein
MKTENIRIAFLVAVVVVVLVALWFWPEYSRAETYETPDATCETSWDNTALWIACQYHRTDLEAPDTLGIWARTSVEAYAGGPAKPYKWFCDLGGMKAPSSSIIYPAAQVLCSTNGRDRIETGLRWEALGIVPQAGATVPFGLKVNVRAGGVAVPAWTAPDGLGNDPATFAAFALTDATRRGPTAPPPAPPALDDTGLYLTWTGSPEAEWYWVDIVRDAERLPRIRTERTRLMLSPYYLAGPSRYTFRVLADAEALQISEPSEPFTAWIVSGVAVDCPPPAECPPAEPCPACPESPPGACPQIQQIVVSCEGKGP